MKNVSKLIISSNFLSFISIQIDYKMAFPGIKLKSIIKRINLIYLIREVLRKKRTRKEDAPSRMEVERVLSSLAFKMES